MRLAADVILESIQIAVKVFFSSLSAGCLQRGAVVRQQSTRPALHIRQCIWSAESSWALQVLCQAVPISYHLLPRLRVRCSLLVMCALLRIFDALHFAHVVDAAANLYPSWAHHHFVWLSSPESNQFNVTNYVQEYKAHNIVRNASGSAV